MLTSFDYEWLTGWKGPKGAAYNQVYEYLLEMGYINRDGSMTLAGAMAKQIYETRNE